uniref:Uncharacterized protein n=1 Tax=Panagrolaimus sp. ES5 TaxID=591445 RepID=A0AC34G0L5_9BILA
MDTSSLALDSVKPKLINGKIVWSGGPSLKQNFDLPVSIIYYMAKNPSTSEVYLKLIQSCKYFFEKLPLLVATRMHGKTKICRNKAVECRKQDGKCCIDIDMKKLSTPIWLTEYLKLSKENISTFTSLIYPQLYQCKKVSLLINKDINFNDFKSCSIFINDYSCFQNGRIIDAVGNAVMLDKVLEMCPNVKYVRYLFGHNLSMFNGATMKKICQLEHLHHLESFTLLNIPDVINVEDISTFLTNHPNRKISLFFAKEISEEYKIQLDAMIDTVIKGEAAKHFILYAGLNEEKYKIMHARFLD